MNQGSIPSDWLWESKKEIDGLLKKNNQNSKPNPASLFKFPSTDINFYYICTACFTRWAGPNIARLERTISNAFFGTRSNIGSDNTSTLCPTCGDHSIAPLCPSCEKYPNADCLTPWCFFNQWPGISALPTRSFTYPTVDIALNVIRKSIQMYSGIIELRQTKYASNWPFFVVFPGVTNEIDKTITKAIESEEFGDSNNTTYSELARQSRLLDLEQYLHLNHNDGLSRIDIAINNMQSTTKTQLIEMVNAGRKLDAIKHLRSLQHEVGIQEAKEIIDRLCSDTLGT